MPQITDEKLNKKAGQLEAPIEPCNTFFIFYKQDTLNGVLSPGKSMEVFILIAFTAP